MFFITGLIIAILFLISTSIPILSWILPYYKLSKLKNLDFKSKIIINIIAIIIIGFIDVNFLLTYVWVFLIIEGLYAIFNKYGKKIGYFDRIFITSLIIGTGICIYTYLNRVNITLLYNMIKNVYIQKSTFTQSEIDMAFSYLKANYVYLVFVYLNTTVFLTYYFLNKETFLKWNVSYLWLIPYIILFFIQRNTSMKSTLILNIIASIKIVYIMYFIKILTKSIIIRTKKPGLSIVISIILTLFVPEISFIFGALISGIKIRVVKLK